MDHLLCVSHFIRIHQLVYSRYCLMVYLHLLWCTYKFSHVKISYVHRVNFYLWLLPFVVTIRRALPLLTYLNIDDHSSVTKLYVYLSQIWTTPFNSSNRNPNPITHREGEKSQCTMCTLISVITLTSTVINRRIFR